jgi:hypothetical protein
MSRRSRLAASLIIAGFLAFLAWWLWPAAAVEPTSSPTKSPAPLVRAPAATDSDRETPMAGSISGIVRAGDERGQPIAGARVCAWALADDERIRDPLAARCTITEHDGHYQLDDLEGGRYRLTAGAVKHLPSTWREAERPREWLLLREYEQRSGVDLSLLPGGVRLAGVVEDVAGGPIPGALIVVSTMFAAGPVATALGDDEGRFELWVAPNQYSISAIASGYTEGGSFVQAPNEALTIHLVPESVLVGHVVDAATHEPVAGVEVRASVHDRQPVISDENGSFRIEGLRPGRYQPEASGEGVFGRLPRAVVLGLGQTSEPIELLVYPAHRLLGQLVARSLDGSERGCAEGRVSVRGTMLTREVSADGDGRVRIEGLPAGRYQIRPSCPGHFATETTELLLEGDLDEQRWLFESGLEIAGLVVAGDRPVSEVWVHAEGNAGAATVTRSDADGRFVLGPLPSDGYLLWLRPEPDKPIEVELRDRSLDDVRLVSGASGTVQASVLDAEGRGIARKYVSVKGSDGRVLSQAMTDGDGRATFVLPVGSVYVAVAQEAEQGDRKPRGVRAEIVAGEITQVELRGATSMLGSITGIVYEGGGPAGEAWVVADPGTGGADEIGPVLCEQDGSFTLADLPTGLWNVRAYREGGGQAIQQGVEIGESVRLELDTPASLVGRVRFADGSAPEHFEVDLLPADGGRPIGLSFYRSEGQFEFEGLAAGRYTVEVDAGSGQAREKIELDADERAELEFVLERRITVRGRLVDANTQQGVSALEVQVQRRGRAAQRSARPDQEGHFVLDNVPVGAVEIMMTPKNWSNSAYPMQGTWITTTDSPAEQDIGDVLVVGRRRARGESRGDVGFDFELDGRLGDSDSFGKVKVRVSNVDRGGPADAAGLREGDVVTAVDGVSVVGGHAGRMGLLVQVAAGASMQLERADGGPVTIIAR